MNTRQQFSFSSPELRYSPLEFNSRKNLATFDESKEKERGCSETDSDKNGHRDLQNYCKTS